MPYTVVQSAFDPFFPKGVRAYWKSTYVDEVSDALLDAMCELAAKRPSSRSTMDIWPLRGAATRVSADATAFGRRPPYLLAFEATWTAPQETEVNIAWARAAHASMQRFSSSGVYLNFPGFGEEKEDLARTAYGANYERLADLKARYDPTNLFRMNHNIRPAT
jgi:FAD/FMN-containing dehydrogenase